MGLYSRLMKEKRERGLETIIPDPRGESQADTAFWMCPHSDHKPLSVVCPIRGCEAKIDQGCLREGQRQLRGVHHARFVAWQISKKANVAAEQIVAGAGINAISSQEPTWMVSGLRMTQTEILAVQCPHCGSRKGVWCQSPKAMLKSFHAKRQQRAYDYWKEVSE